MSSCNGRDGRRKCTEPCSRYYVDDNLPLIRGYCDRHTRQKVGTLIASHKAHSMVQRHQHIMAYGMHASMPSGMSYCTVADDDIATAKRLQDAIEAVQVYREYSRDYMDVDSYASPPASPRPVNNFSDSDDEAPAAVIMSDDEARPPLRRANATINYKRRKVVNVLSEDDDYDDSFVVDDDEPIIHESWSSSSEDDDTGTTTTTTAASGDDEVPIGTRLKRKRNTSPKRYRTIYD